MKGPNRRVWLNLWHRNRFQASMKPVDPQGELHGIDALVRRGQTGIGYVFISDRRGERPALSVKELKAQRGMREKVHVRGIEGHRVSAEQHPATQLHIRHGVR